MYAKRSTGVFKVITIRDGYSTAVVQLFRRYAPTQAEPTPALPTGTLTYTFSTGVLSGATASFNGWSQQIPAATDSTKLFVTMATARSQGATDDIIVDSSVTPPVNEWSTPVEYIADGMAYAPVTIYKRSATAPNDKPDNNARYYFKTVGTGASQIKAGTLVAPSGGSLNGWSTIIPASNGLPCWTRQATAVARSTDDYDEIASTEWSDPASKFVEDGTDGTDGLSAPYYVQEWYAWSSVAQTASITTSPFEEPYSGWSEGAIPANTGGLAYLWRKSVKYTYNAQTNAYVAGTAQYVRLSGTNGTSIDVKGTVDYVVAAGGSLPTQGVSVGEQGIILNKNKLYSYTNMGWSQHMTNVADGDSYTVTKDNTIDGVNLKGHLLMWSDEAHTADSNKGWIDLGVFQGLNGITYYTHIAWATSINTSIPWSGTIPAGQISTPNYGQGAISGGQIVPASDGSKPWMGVLINTNPAADTTNYHYYTWNFAKGAKGDKGDKGDPGEDSKEREWIYKRSTTRPDTPSSFKNIVFHDMSTDAIAGMVNSSSDLPQTESEGARYVVLDSQYGKNSFYIYHDGSWDDAGGTADTADAYYFEDDGLWRMWNGVDWVEIETTDVRYDFRQVDGYVPDGWTDHAQGITDSNPTEWTSYRDYDKTAQRWGAFHTPVIWSHWGENGMDGDGVQYVFKLYASKLATAQEESYKPTKGTQDASGEWSANNSVLDPDQIGTWHDDAPSPTSELPYCYCSVIKRTNGTWGDFETLGLWSRWSEDGHNAPYEEKQYANYDSDSTNQNGEPNGNRQGNWSSTIPATSNSYPYLWERVRQRTYDANNQLISLGENEGWTYGLLTKPGVKGSTGRMQYPAGEYSNLIKYTRTDDVCPVVHYTDGNGNDAGYWYLDADTNWKGETSDSAVAPSNTPGNPWKQAERYGMVITEALFAMFAKLGSFVVAEDFFISQYGTLFGPNGAIAVTSQRTEGSVYIGTDGLGKHIPYLALPNNVDEACYTYFSVADPMVDKLPSSGYKFRPKKVVNALTGEEYMAEGKVHVDSDGNLEIKGATMIDHVEILKGQAYSYESSLHGIKVEYYLFDVEKGNPYPETSLDGCYPIGKISLKSNRLFVYTEGVLNQSEYRGEGDDSSLHIMLPPPHCFIGQSIVITNRTYGFKKGNVTLEQAYWKKNGNDFICLTHKNFIQGTEEQVDDWTVPYAYKNQIKYGANLIDCAPYDINNDHYPVLLNGIWQLAEGSNEGDDFIFKYPIIEEYIFLDDYEWIELTATEGERRKEEPPIVPSEAIPYNAVWLITRSERKQED